MAQQRVPGTICRMSSIGSISPVMSAMGAGRTAVQISVPTSTGPISSANIDLEAAVRRVATILYMRSRTEVPPDVIDMGGGLFNVVV
jgi:hypothetical protein